MWLWKVLPHQHCWETLDKPAMGFLCCASGCHAQDNATLLSTAGGQELRKGGVPQALPGLLFDTLPLLQPDLHPPALFLLCSQGSRWGMSQTAGTANVPSLGRRCSCLMSPAVITAK